MTNVWVFLRTHPVYILWWFKWFCLFAQITEIDCMSLATFIRREYDLQWGEVAILSPSYCIQDGNIYCIMLFLFKRSLGISSFSKGLVTSKWRWMYVWILESSNEMLNVQKANSEILRQTIMYSFGLCSHSRSVCIVTMQQRKDDE